VTTGARVYRLGRRCAADFIALLDQLLAAFPRAPVIAVICDNDSIHHARKVTAYLEEHPRLELLHDARYSPHDNPVEMSLPQCELRRSPLAWLPGSLSFEVSVGVLSSVQRRRLW
jgi:DDE superfamily endonuclease